MITISNSDILKASGTILHGVNCQGVMGAGLARQIRVKYPQVFIDYKNFLSTCDTAPLGEIVVTPGEVTIVSGFTQEYYGSSGCFVSYEALTAVLHKTMQRIDGCINIPRIGAGLAGGDWPFIKQIIEMVEQHHGREFVLHEM